jgi:osmotically-inducible protein OsmY
MTRKLIAIAAAAAAASMLQGCFPLVATGVGATALVATDRRTTGIYIEDEAIELKSLRVLCASRAPT